MSILIDENPKEDATKQVLTGTELAMEQFKGERNSFEFFWGCPICKTDKYLMDL